MLALFYIIISYPVAFIFSNNIINTLSYHYILQYFLLEKNYSSNNKSQFKIIILNIRIR